MVRIVKNIVGIRTLKTALGAALAIILAQVLGLKYIASAGIITILSIQSTKRQSVEIAIKRLLATLIALVIGSVLFLLMGYNPLTFGIYLLLFIPITAKFGLTDGIVMASVLVTHLLGEKSVAPSLLINEVLLFIIGAGVALLLNLYMPSIEGELFKYRQEIEEEMFKLFEQMAGCLRAESACINPHAFESLKQKIQVAQREAYKHSNNYLFAKASPYERYFEMRCNQFQTMCYMKEHFKRFFMTFEETEIVASFAKKVADSIHGEIMAKELIDTLETLRDTFKASNLPKTREEFENRAMLYQYLNDIEHFLQIKQNFKESLTPEEVKIYMKGYKSK